MYPEVNILRFITGEDPKFCLINYHRGGSQLFQLDAPKLFGLCKHPSIPFGRRMQFCQHKEMHNQQHENTNQRVLFSVSQHFSFDD